MSFYQQWLRVFLLFKKLGSKGGRDQYVLSLYRTLTELAEALLEKDKWRREERNHSESPTCCAFLGGYMAAFWKAVLPTERLFGKRH